MKWYTALVFGEGLLRIMKLLLFIATHLDNVDPAQLGQLEFSVDHWESRFAEAYAHDFPHEKEQDK